VTIEFAYGEAMPDVDCDPLSIYRAVLNLVTNAIDAAEQGGGLVTIAAQPGDDGKSVTIAVADNGPGISPEAKDKLFQAFHSTKASKGTGLGLAVTKKIVDEHRGAIDIKTEAGKGTTFAISLPVARPEFCGCAP
jgi:signal transduction histidine kinase